LQESAYATAARLEQDHWSYVGRRKLFARGIEKLSVAHDQPVLDVGTSAGTSLRMLRDIRFGKITGLDISTEAIHGACVSVAVGVLVRGSA